MRHGGLPLRAILRASLAERNASSRWLVLSRNQLETAEYAIATTFLVLNLERWHRQLFSSFACCFVAPSRYRWTFNLALTQCEACLMSFLTR